MTADQHDMRRDQVGAESKPSGSVPAASIRSDELLRGHSEVLIEHDGCLYRLRLTRAGKLILHK